MLTKDTQKRPCKARDGPGSGGLTERQQRALTALLTSQTALEAAQKSGVGYRTLKRWLEEDSNFREVYKELSAAALHDAVRQSRRNLTGALATLAGIAADPAQPAAARVSAAKSTIELSLKLGEQADVVKRIETLEAAGGDGH